MSESKLIDVDDIDIVDDFFLNLDLKNGHFNFGLIDYFCGEERNFENKSIGDVKEIIKDHHFGDVVFEMNEEEGEFYKDEYCWYLSYFQVNGADGLCWAIDTKHDSRKRLLEMIENFS